jgi:hypothetical protein
LTSIGAAAVGEHAARDTEQPPLRLLGNLPPAPPSNLEGLRDGILSKRLIGAA